VPAEDQRFPTPCGPSADQRERILKRKSPHTNGLDRTKESRAWPGMTDSHPSWRPPAMGVSSGKSAGCVVAASAHGDQVIADMSVTVVIRWAPCVSVRCGTRVARQ
jgi:hypothetical protein